MLTTFLARGIFSIHQIQKKVKKRPEPKKFLYPKITGIVSVNLAKEFFKYILYFKTFLAEPHMAHITPILKKKISNLKFISFFIYIFRKSLSNIGPREVDPLYPAYCVPFLQPTDDPDQFLCPFEVPTLIQFFLWGCDSLSD